ncbi:NADP-dependent phosphogluconate dehydrogenase [Cytophagaceae bacterium YF14B1]|uniref:6-phosphogluconate dehydrogenase, decarboxylating n=1 Tax=Xanthocytophaga flava TaxID=3048013 RepID=A0AAE3UAS0_9BACT|nr:NADP-dependent phosphogluconate dehydrogenase [Xanthocytophaga flavus]MDJ1483633.1 NADP-dependent phosphogluconate dehydrogenase [Xanthocytophaga flavus]
MSQQYDFGMVGLGVMGRNFILNVADHGFSAIGLDTDTAKSTALHQEGSGKPVKGTTSKQEFVSSLKSPRTIMLLVPAGGPVDAVIEDLLPLLDKGDLLIDGGNSFYTDTNRREKYLSEKGIHFMGIGVSGGSKGARFGPSIMPGGPKDAYGIVQPILEAVSAKVNGDPCVAYLGSGSAGNYVKMVHNGIEYGLMQLISETYDLMKRGLGLTNEELHEVYARWNTQRLQSFLIEITASIFTTDDTLASGKLVDAILDRAKQKGTGKWTSQNAMDLGTPVPTIDMAVTMRELSALKEERVQAEKLYGTTSAISGDKKAVVDQIEQALYFAYIITYAQGLAQLTTASEEYKYGLELETVARIWRGGCIIRAGLLEHIRQAYSKTPDLANLLLDETTAKEVNAVQAATRHVVSYGVTSGIPVPALAACLSYFDAYRSGRLPSNLIQAQRDFFGSHTYERLDREGIFHTDWE